MVKKDFKCLPHRCSIIVNIYYKFLITEIIIFQFLKKLIGFLYTVQTQIEGLQLKKIVLHTCTFMD